VDHVENFTTTLEKIKPSSALIVTMRQIETLTQRGTSSSVIYP